MAGINFAAVKELVPLSVGLDLVGYDGGSRGPCPVHGSTSEHSRTFSVDHDSGVWYCHKCKAGGSVLDLVARCNGVTIFEAARQLCEAAAVEVPWVGRGSR